MEPNKKEVNISDESDISVAKRVLKKMASELEFESKASEEIAIVVSELATNLLKYPKRGQLRFTALKESGRFGIQIESLDDGPGIKPDDKLEDGITSGRSLGYGLGTINRLMDEFVILPEQEEKSGAHIICKRWVRNKESGYVSNCPLEIGLATRPHPSMKVSGDTFVVKKWEKSALVSVVDGVGHGEFAHVAAMKARNYVEDHYDQDISNIFRGVELNCRGTRGVVMALARFDWSNSKLIFGSVGNIETHVHGGSDKINFFVRRGIIGKRAPMPRVTEHHWDPRAIMIIHSDGLQSIRHWGEYLNDNNDKSSTSIAQQMLHDYARPEDDATVVIIKNATS